MRIVIDMNLSPEWVDVFAAAGWVATHWSSLGSARAPDVDVMAGARRQGALVFTNDLDFGAILALTGAHGPSVVQLRAHDLMPDTVGALVVAVMREHETVLERGAILVIDSFRSRVRLLPLTTDSDD